MVFLSCLIWIFFRIMTFYSWGIGPRSFQSIHLLGGLLFLAYLFICLRSRLNEKSKGGFHETKRMRINTFWITQWPQFTSGELFRCCEEVLSRSEKLGLPRPANRLFTWAYRPGERRDSADLYPGLIAPRTQQCLDRFHSNPAIHGAQRQLPGVGVHGVDDGRQAIDPRFGV